MVDTTDVKVKVYRAKQHPYGEHWRVVNVNAGMLLGRVRRAARSKGREVWQASATLTNGPGTSLGSFATRRDAERAIVQYHGERLPA